MNEKKESQCMCLQQAESQRVPASFVHMHQGVALLRDLALLPVSRLVPRPSPNFPSLAVRLNRTASDRKLSEGLGTRLTSVSCFLYTTCTIIFITC